MSKTIPSILLAALTLTACASGTQPTPAISRTPQANLMAECPDVPSASSGKLPDLDANHKAAMRSYHDCKDRHQGLVEWVKKGANDAARH